MEEGHGPHRVPIILVENLLAYNGGELFRPAVIGDAVGVAVAAVGDRGFPEEELVEVVEAVGLAAFGAKHFAGAITGRMYGRIGAEPGSHIAPDPGIEGVLEPVVGA